MNNDFDAEVTSSSETESIVDDDEVPFEEDRDNFTDLHCLWNFIDSRPFYRVTMALNRFKFLLRCMRFDNYRN